MARFVSHTSASENVDGSGTSGGNNKMERGSSVVANPVWEPGGAQDFAQRFDSPEYAQSFADGCNAEHKNPTRMSAESHRKKSKEHLTEDDKAALAALENGEGI